MRESLTGVKLKNTISALKKLLIALMACNKNSLSEEQSKIVACLYCLAAMRDPGEGRLKNGDLFTSFSIREVMVQAMMITDEIARESLFPIFVRVDANLFGLGDYFSFEGILRDRGIKRPAVVNVDFLENYHEFPQLMRW